jgi:hypothetical protein
MPYTITVQVFPARHRPSAIFAPFLSRISDAAKTKEMKKEQNKKKRRKQNVIDPQKR